MKKIKIKEKGRMIRIFVDGISEFYREIPKYEEKVEIKVEVVIK